MERIVQYNGIEIKYKITRKKVKNIILRIKPDCSVEVSANGRVSLKYIDSFVIRKGSFILSAIDNFKEAEKTISKPLYDDNEFIFIVEHLFENVYNQFINENINKPTLKFRLMKSRWGSCNFVKGIITINRNMIYCTQEQIYYVIVHEFAHLIVPNHSKEFYAVVEKYCKDYKRIRKELKNINF